MSALLKPVPRYIFCIVEPVLLFAGFATSAMSTPTYVASLLSASRPHGLLPTEHILALQLSNLYLLLAFITIFVLNTTSEIKVVRAYLSALWWGDLGHLSSTAWCLGREGMAAASSWTTITWANFLIPSFLFLARTFYLLGVFGSDVVVDGEKLE
jgi:hypothetical protein